MAFIALQEEFTLSVEALKRVFRVPRPEEITVVKERDNNNGKTAEEKERLRENAEIMQRVRDVNAYDIRLYDYSE